MQTRIDSLDHLMNENDDELDFSIEDDVISAFSTQSVFTTHSTNIDLFWITVFLRASRAHSQIREPAITIISSKNRSIEVQGGVDIARSLQRMELK